MYETQFYEEEYRNDIGQVIQPGDDVVFVASGRANSVSIRKGTFLGVRKYVDNPDDVLSVTCEYDHVMRVFLLDWPHPDRYNAENIVNRTIKSKSNLQLGRVYKLDTNAWELKT